jgi:hypothetical protein
MATSTIQSSSETPKAPSKKARTVKRNAGSGVTKGRSRNKNSESMTSKIIRQGKDAVSGAYDTAAKARRSMPKMPSARELRDSGHSVYSMMEERPLVLGAVGLGVGIALAALLPSLKHNDNRR